MLKFITVANMNTKTIQENRIVYADVLRIMATFAVIVLHVCARRWGSSFGNYEWEVLNIYDSLTRWCVPVFIMLSGMLFLNPSHTVTYDKLFKKTIPRILAALFFWGFAYSLYGLRDKVLHEGFSEIVLDIWTIGRNIMGTTIWFHLWFLYAIIGLYLLTPAIRLFVSAAKEKDIRYVLWLFFIFGTCFRVINEFSPYKINFSIPELSSYLGYFIAGYYFSTYQLSQTTKYLFFGGGLLSLGFTIYITHFLSHLKGSPNEYFYSYILPNTMIVAYSIFLFIKNIENRDHFFLSFIYKNKYLTQLSSYCFGIYLVHDFFREWVSPKIEVNNFHPIFAVPLISIIIFILSVFVVMVLSKIPVLNKWIM